MVSLCSYKVGLAGGGGGGKSGKADLFSGSKQFGELNEPTELWKNEFDMFGRLHYEQIHVRGRFTRMLKIVGDISQHFDRIYMDAHITLFALDSGLILLNRFRTDTTVRKRNGKSKQTL